MDLTRLCRHVVAGALSALLVLLGTAGQAMASMEAPADPSSAESALAAQLAATHGGVVDGNRIRYPDGTVFVAVDDHVMSLGQCSGGQFCLWSSSGFQGSFTYKTGTYVTRNISGAVGSFWNNRSGVARLYSNSGTASTCYENGVQRSSVSSSYSSAAKVYLAGGSSC